MKQLYRFIRFFGLRSGLILWVKVRLGVLGNIRIPELAHPFRIRKGTTDLPIFQQIFLSRSYDIVINYPPQLIIDGGANIGLSAIFFGSRYPDAKVIAIEPEASNFQLLVENTSRYKNVECKLGAIWSTKTNLTVIDSNQGHSGFITAKRENSGSTVTTFTIDEIANGRSIDILKIDIEGSEKELFSENYQSWLPMVKCLIIEIHDTTNPGASKSVLTAVSQYDFNLLVGGENLIFINNNSAKAATTQSKDTIADRQK